MSKRFFALSVATAALAFVGAGCTSSVKVDSTMKGSEPVACTEDAMRCPDGSYVGRTGPNCEFAPCPGPSGAADVDVRAY